MAVVTAMETYFYFSPAGEVLHVVAYTVLCVLAWWAAFKLHRRGERLPWVLVALCVTLWFAGDAWELFEVHVFGGTPAVGLADAFWLGGYPLLASSLALMARRRAPGRLRGAVVDALTLTVAAGAVSWQFIMKPLAEGFTVAQSAVPLLYPFADVVLLSGALVVALSPGRRTAPTRLVLAGAVWFLAMDLGWNVLPLFLPEDVYGRLGAAMILGNALVVAAGLHPARNELTNPGVAAGTLHPGRIFFLAVALMTAPLLTLISDDKITAVVASAACAMLVIVRFAAAVREQERAQAQLAYQARCDPLTGLANRSVLGDRLARAVPAPDAPVAVLYLDLDGFKEINDRYGHAAGDAVLRTVAGRLSQAVREQDLVARLGGDEFVLLCPGVTAEEAARLAERLISDVAWPVPFEGRYLTVGASIGVATRMSRADEGLLRIADAAMYEAKRLGRGRYVLS
ncbi:GGDEF domain-containing protein [Couchioplanes caeruleus]|uniref:GGDEF domain-containing protein n=1 Tax=Couchioplanes caeruleus TaxID=56438 RepID=UPI0020BDD316|nr:GGDEF domain-containing protein [Couchioplanes caeruleus]UQU64347.1 GGDEF domain-containing protein [Couchioplanes caeruleus]